MEQSLENGKKSTINTHYWLPLMQNESEINYVGKSFKHATWCSLVNIF